MTERADDIMVNHTVSWSPYGAYFLFFIFVERLWMVRNRVLQVHNEDHRVTGTGKRYVYISLVMPKF